MPADKWAQYAEQPQSGDKWAQYAEPQPQQMQPQPQQAGATIQNAQSGVLPWLRNLEGDIRYGTGVTAPGRLLHFLGGQPTSAGVNPATEEKMTGAYMGPIHAAQGAAQLPSQPWQGTKAIAGGALDTLGSIPAFPEGEAMGALRGIPAKVGEAAQGAAEGAGDLNNTLARWLRYPASARQSQLGRPGTIKNILPSFLQKYTIPDIAIPKGDLGTITNPGPYAEIPIKAPKIPEPGLSSIAERDATRMNVPYAGEEEASQAAEIAGRDNSFPKPLRPVVGTPEEFQTYDNQMSRLKQEASDAGTYSAARGKVAKKLNYQQRIERAY